MSRSKQWWLVFAIVLGVLVALRVALPDIIKRQINAQLAQIEGYDGHVEDVDLALWRGAYAMDGLRIQKTDSTNPDAFLTCRRVELNLDWTGLLGGTLVAWVRFIEPTLNVVTSPNKAEAQTGADVNWPEVIQGLYPFHIRRVEMRDGTVSYRTVRIDREDALMLEGVNSTLSNITNQPNERGEAYADLVLQARAAGSAPLRIGGKVDMLAEQPTFDVDFTLEHVPLQRVNPWMREYVKADVESGDFSLFMEVAAAEGEFQGYAKPLMQNVNVLSSEDQDEGMLRKLWEGLLDVAANVLENEDEDQVAARTPFGGRIKDPDVGVIETMVSVLSNAFVGAFAHSLEQTVSIRGVKDNASKLASAEEGAPGPSKTDSNQEEDQDDEQPRRGPRQRL